MKKKILIVGIEMLPAGTEGACISFLSRLDPQKYDTELLLSVKGGDFLSRVPQYVKVEEMSGEGGLFLLDKYNARKIIGRFLKRKPSLIGGLLKYIVKLPFSKGKQRSYIKNRIWLELMKSLPKHPGKYDTVVAFWGDRTVFYAVDKVKADRIIGWQHFDFETPPREPSLYSKYFSKCDKIVAVSVEVADSVKREIPEMSDKLTVIENFTDSDRIKEKSFEAVDDIAENGLRILTVGRLEYQKGLDIAIQAIAELVKNGFDISWYIIGKGSEEDNLKTTAVQLGIEDRVCFLGYRDNPYKYMRTCDLYLQPSRYEGKPISVEEAKIIGIPVIACDYSSAQKQLCGYGTVCKTTVGGIQKAIEEFCVSGDRSKKPIKVDNDVYDRLINDLL